MRTMTRPELEETIYRLDGPLRQALPEMDGLLRRARVEPGSRALDVGAGTGYASLPLAAAVGEDGSVRCLDGERALLDVLAAKARARGLAERVRTEVGPATALPYDRGTFDVVCATYLLHELADDARAALAEMHRVLRPLGRLILADYRRLPDRARTEEIERWYGRQADGGGDDEVHLRFDLDETERMLTDAGFTDIELGSWLEFHQHAIATK